MYLTWGIQELTHENIRSFLVDLSVTLKGRRFNFVDHNGDILEDLRLFSPPEIEIWASGVHAITLRVGALEQAIFTLVSYYPKEGSAPVVRDESLCRVWFLFDPNELEIRTESLHPATDGAVNVIKLQYIQA